MTNPFRYSSKDFDTFLADINADPELVDAPEWFKKLIAGMGDVQSTYNDMVANQAFLETAFTNYAIRNHLKLIDYDLTKPTTSSGTCIFYLVSTVSLPITFTAAQQSAFSQGTVNLSGKRFEARTSKTITSLTTGTFAWSSGVLFTVAYDFLYTGHKVRLTTTNTLPSGLSTGTDYYVVRNSSTSISFAPTIADAYAGTNLITGSAGTGTHTYTIYSFTNTLYQQETKSQYVLGKSDGSTMFQEFPCSDKYIIDDTIIITIAASTYTLVTTFAASLITDKVFKSINMSNSQTKIQFADGVRGVLPPANDIYILYAVGGGVNSNVSTLNRINAYAGGNSSIAGVSNATIMNGGADEENANYAKTLAPQLLKIRDTFVTVPDGEALALKYGGLSLVKILPNYYGALSCRVLGVATGGGDPSSALRSAIQAMLIAKSVFSQVDVRFTTATFTAVTFTGSFKLWTTYLWANVLPYIQIALKLFFSDLGSEIYNTYFYQNISTAITLVNTYFSTSFLTTDSQLTNLIKNLNPDGNTPYRNFGDTIHLSDIDAYIQGNVEGIDYFTMTVPTLPLVQDADETLTATGITLNLTQL
jgi:hypothetical protein